MLRYGWVSAVLLVLQLFAVDDGEQKGSDDPMIEATALGRYLSNSDFFSTSPYGFILFETVYDWDDWRLSGGVFAQKGLPYPDVPLNHLYVDYFGEASHFRIGKTFSKIGVLDYFSTLDTLTPLRFEFFDDPNMAIKRVPVWMAQYDHYVNDSFKISTYVLPYDSKYQDYTGFYVNYALNRFVPEHYSEFFAQDPIGQQLFSPLYYNAISPFIAHEIESKLPSSTWKLNNTSFGFTAEYTGNNAKIGALYFNRYAEVPLIRVDQNLLDAAIAYENGESSLPSLTEYIASLDLDPIKSVEGYRYNQAGVYGETTVDSYGLRAEAAYRDKVPLLNDFGSVSSLGFAVDRMDGEAYYAFETQMLHLEPYNKNAFIGMLSAKSEPFSWLVFQSRFENRLIAAQAGSYSDVAIIPGFSVHYKNTDLLIQGIVSHNNSETNTLSILLRTVF